MTSVSSEKKNTAAEKIESETSGHHLMEDLGDIIVNLLCCCGKTVTKGNTNQGRKYKKVRKVVKFTKIARKAGSMAIEATSCIVSKLAEGSADVSDDYEILAS